jgi:hypothetical protein
VKALSAKRRARFEHMTLPQIRQALRHTAISPPRTSGRARECRPAASRRASSSSTTSSADPGDPELGEPLSELAHLHGLRHLIVGSDWPGDLVDEAHALAVAILGAIDDREAAVR